MIDLNAWQLKHHVSDEAMRELAAVFVNVSTPGPLTKEAHIMDAIRIEASKQGGRLWRNNRGAGVLKNGSFVRWGLANETEAMNKVCKSADLIGIKPVLITPDMVGTTVGQFWSVECKHGGWKPSQADPAQMAWAVLVHRLGGCSEFNNTGEL
jgi:hypothetical protein